METVHTVEDLRERVGAWRRAGQRIAFVPTMGNLHRGHLELVRQAKVHAARVVASVFVNPLQFGANEDFSRYPRTLGEDQAALTGAGCDLLFAPSAAAMYPRGMEGLTRVSVPGVSEILCGEYRPGHFEGVATVVTILLHQAQPDVALFGEKDYQQLFVIRRLVEDLHLPVAIVGVPTERDADGLALSSRNQYLSAEERARAPQLYAVLREIAAGLRAGRRDFGALLEEAVKTLEGGGFRPQYLEIRRPDLSLPQVTDEAFVVLAAAYLGNTRLIDNVQV